MEQEMLVSNDQLEEGASLGERYQLGDLEAVYRVAYTRKDVRRYRIFVLLVSLMMLYLLLFVVLIYIIFSNLGHSYYSLFPFFILGTIFSNFFILFNSVSRRKWGNQPLISPRERHLRVYVYPDGIVKQTDRSSEIVRWADVFKIVYVPLQAGNVQSTGIANSVDRTGTAGITINLHGGKHLTLSGALQNIAELAERLNYRHDTSRLYRQ